MSSSRGRPARFSLRTRVLSIALIPSFALLAGGGAVSANLILGAWRQRETAQLLTNPAMFKALAAVAVITLLTLVAVTTAVRMGNGMVRRLRRLEADTVAAEQRLPMIVNRLRAGEKIDVGAEIPSLDHPGDELGRLAAAVNQAQQTAVAAAVQEARLRDGMHAVFMNIARRSQSVVQRQLQVLDLAERAESDPDQLDLLFQIDHLSTRERRNAENLIILGGGQLGRQWRNPVPLVDVVRSAVAETEDYQRVVVEAMPKVRVTGRAVADLMHLLAELADNAIVFSAPESCVEVRSNLVGRGVVVEIVDQGIGMGYEQREALNEMFRDPHRFGVFELAGDARIGFFVVSNLARRHSLRVSLLESPHGGVRAVVLVPTELLAADDEVDDDTTWSGAAFEAPPVPRMRAVPSRGRADGAPPRPGFAPDRPGVGAVAERVDWGAAGPARPTPGAPVADEAAPPGHEPPPAAADREGAGPEQNCAQRTDLPDLESTAELDAVDYLGQAQRRTQRRPASAGHPGPAATVGRPPLPRRRRQASLAKPLRNRPAAVDESVIPPMSEQDHDHDARRAQTMMAAFQRGTDHGRHGGDS